jgi:hypothetical protein
VTVGVTLTFTAGDGVAVGTSVGNTIGVGSGVGVGVTLPVNVFPKNCILPIPIRIRRKTTMILIIMRLFGDRLRLPSINGAWYDESSI